MQPIRRYRTRQLAAAALAVLVALVLAACGSSSSASSTSTSTSGAPSAAAKSPAGAPGGRFTALRGCLKKEGITLPQRVPGQTGQGAPPTGGAAPLAGGGFLGGRLPAGVSRAKFEAALKKCGGGAVQGRLGAGGRLRSPGFAKALASFATCMRQNGINVPKPNTTGSGPIFDTRGLDTSSAKFRAASQKCASLLKVARPAGVSVPPGGQASAGAPSAEPPPTVGP